MRKDFDFKCTGQCVCKLALRRVYFIQSQPLKGHRQPQVFAGVQAIGAIFCNTENGADSYRRAIAIAITIAVDRSFFTIGIGTICRDI